MKTVLTVIIVLLTLGCGPALYVDFDESQDFEAYSTYDFYPDIASGLNQLDDKRIMKAIDSVLGSRNYVRTEANRFFINFYAETKPAARNSIGVGLGSGGVNGGVGVSGGIPIGGPIVRQRLTIDVIDAMGDQRLVWQAVVEADMKERSTPAKKEAFYFAMVKRAFSKFPPKK